MKPRSIVVCALLISAAALTAEDKIGEALYMEGDVGVIRNSAELDPAEVQIGMGIENFDLLKTGSTGLAEVRVSSTKTPAMTIKVSRNTQFSLELSKLGSKQQTSVNLLSGTLSMKVSKLTGSQDVKLRTESAAMGVRGTQFSVTSPPSGDILITCDEGEVVCTDEDGKQLAALPGTAIEKMAGEKFRSIPVAVSDLETFRNNWLTERIQALQANALRAIGDFSKLYLSLSAELSSNYAALMKSQAVLTKWYAEDTFGKIGGRMELMKEKKEIVGTLFKLRKTLFRFERIYYRLMELKEYYDQGYGRGLISTGMTSAQFFQRFEREKKTLERTMASIRYVAKLYALRNDGSVPTGAFDEPNDQSEEDFFDSSGP
jgi:hypothetical protein